MTLAERASVGMCVKDRINFTSCKWSQDVHYKFDG